MRRSRWMAAAWLFGSLVVLATAAGCWDTRYACTGDENCVRGGVGGYCLPSSSGLACVFPDKGCVNRLRWDPTAPDDLAGRCVQLACDDKLQNGLPGLENGRETDVDCGGPCPACAVGKACASDPDCASRACIGGTCAPASCSDKRRNGGESDIDCGGPCPVCRDSFRCDTNADCKSADCFENICRTPQCNDSRRNGKEIDVDCGGPDCRGCSIGKGCAGGTDCGSGLCTGGLCVGVRFGDARSITGIDSPIGLLAVDYDRDTDLDLLVNNEQGSSVHPPWSSVALIRGDGRGAFTLTAPQTSTQAHAKTMVTSDFDGNGFPDVALPNSSSADDKYEKWEVTLLLNGTQGPVDPVEQTLTAPSRGAAVADFDGDSLPDVAFTLENDHMGMVFSTGNGGFRNNYVLGKDLPQPPLLANDRPYDHRLLALDLNEDTFPDLVYLSSRKGIVTLFNTADKKGQFSRGQSIAVGSGIVGAITQGDWNRDGHVDLACVTSSGEVVMLPGSGKGGFGVALFADGDRAVDITAADMNGDGNLDVVTSTAGKGLQILYGNGKGDLVRGADLPLPAGAAATQKVSELVTGDWNGDGSLDVAAVSREAHAVYVWLQRP